MTEPDAFIGTVVEGRRVVSVVASGGTGVVYRAVDGEDRPVAVKVLHTKHRLDGDAATRFQREATLEEVRHPNIVEVRSAGVLDDGRPYLTMELLEGQTLEDRLAREGPLPIAEAARIGVGILDGLGAAHAAGVVHRDVKPANVFLARLGEATVPKLLDFSVARVSDEHSATVTATGDIVGTPLYLAPEQATGVKPWDHRIDIWAVGVLLYHVLTGVPPFGAKQLAELILMIVSQEPRPARALRPEVPEALEAVLRRAMKKPAAERFESAAQMATALREACLVP